MCERRESGVIGISRAMKLPSAHAPAVQTMQTSTRLFPITRTWWVKSYSLLSAIPPTSPSPPPQRCPVISSRNWDDVEPSIRRCRAAIKRIPQQNGIFGWRTRRGKTVGSQPMTTGWGQAAKHTSRVAGMSVSSSGSTERMRWWRIAGYPCSAGRKDLHTMRPIFWKFTKTKVNCRICSFIRNIFPSGCFRRPWGETGHPKQTTFPIHPWSILVLPRSWGEVVGERGCGRL